MQLTSDMAKGFYVGAGLALAAVAVGVNTLRPPTIEFRLNAEQAKQVATCSADTNGAAAAVGKALDKMRKGEKYVVLSFAELAASGASAAAPSGPGCVKPPAQLAPGGS